MNKSNKKEFYFSVIMTIYNIEKYLEEAILSIINQTLPFEKYIQIILVNDGSPDDSGKICRKYSKKYPNNIIYIEKENGGVSSARNAGLEVAEGKVINFLDSDDYFSNNAFEKVKEFYDNDKSGVDVVAINLINFENSCGSWVNGKYFEKTRIIDMNKDIHFMQCQVGASFIKKEIALKYRYDEKIKIHEDSHYLYRIFRDKPLCGVISDATYWHRIRNNGTSATQTIKHKNNVFNMSGYLFKDLINFYKIKNPVLPSFLQTFIILEFNYYVIEKISELTLTNDEQKKLKSDIKYIIDNLSYEDINNHPFISADIKKRYRKLKKNINLLYNKAFLNNPLEYSNIPKKIYHKTRSFLGKIKKRIRFPFSRSIKKIIELENIVNEEQQKQNKMQNIINDQQHKIEELMSIKTRYDDELVELIETFRQTKNDLEELKKETNFNLEQDTKYLYYFHGGSGNRGCEALVRTITENIKAKREKFLLISFRKKEDVEDNINKLVKYIIEPKLTSNNKRIEYMGDSKFNFDDMGIEQYISKLDKSSIGISIGGDNYCYGEYVNSLLAQYNRLMHKYGIKTALLGCSIEPDILKDEMLLKDLNTYDLIIARESITYNALLEAGINKNTKLVPDPAFKLKTIKLDLPNNFIENNTIGINMSPLIQSYDKKNNVTYDNYRNLIKYIIDNTNYNVALIPHVFWEKTNDLEAMKPLYEEFSYSNRVILIGKHSAEELKGFISRCKMFVGARTHATIAAYSSCIPTLTVGYSVKSKGIALDLFGSYKNYVIPVQDLKDKNDLVKAFNFIESNYDKIKKYLEKTIPLYIKPIDNYDKYIKELENKKITTTLPVEECTGCSACVNICPVKCIKFKTDKNGFKYPSINYKECIKCGKCQKICPIGKSIKNEIKSQAYAIKAKDEVRLNSSSGGVFGVIANKILEENGAVYGASFDNNFKLGHIKITKKKDLYKIQGSKYLQSDLKNVFSEIKIMLEENKKVLFSGTPCQVKGLKHYLQKDYKNLFTIDVICHGVPSPYVFEKYKKKLEEISKSKIIDYSFRNKDLGWKKFSTKIMFENKKIISEPFDKNIYMQGFLRNLYLRDSCYLCTSNNFTSTSDITLGDYWGIEDIHPEFNDDKGISLVLINSEKGKQLFKDVSNEFDYIKTELSEAVKYNKAIYKPAFYNKNRKDFFDKLDEEDIVKNISNNLYDKE